MKWSITEGLRPMKIRDFKLSGEDRERSMGGYFDWEKRWSDHQRDGVDAEIVFPNGGGLMAWATPDPRLATALCRAQNDWYHEVVGPYFHKTMPAALVAPSDVDEAIKEVERVVNMGFRAINIPVRPFHESAGAKSSQIGYNSPMFEPLWNAIEDADVPLTCHVATGKDPRTASGEGGAVINYVTHALTPAIEPFTHFCASGILERHPKLRFGTVESGIGFVPWMSDALSEWDHHMPYWDDVQSDSTLYFKVHGTCTAREDKRMDPDWWFIRDHARFVDGDYDQTEEDWSAAAAHHDTCLPHIGVEFDDKRDKARTGFINGGHYTELRSTFSSGSVYVVCLGNGWYESWDGDVAWISIPGTAH